jgi:Zn-dependent protease with chaperone function
LVLLTDQGLPAALLLLGAAWLGQEVLLASFRLHAIRVGPDQLPELWNRYLSVGARLGLAQVPPLYVQQSGGVVNAFAARAARRMQVVLQSGLLDALEHDPEALEFVIAHELGHHLARHTTLGKQLFILPMGLMGLLPLQLGLSRGQELTADRYGLHGSSLSAAERALIVLLGGRVARQASASVVVAQWREVGFWGRLVELAGTHPNAARRIGQVRERVHRMAGSGAGAPLATTWIPSDAGEPLRTRVAAEGVR